MKKSSIFFISLGISVPLVILLFFFAFIPYRKRTMNVNYIVRITSIQFPKGTITIETNDNGEFATQGKFKLKPREINPFINSLPFGSLDNLDSTTLCQTYFLLSPQNQPHIENKSLYLFLRDCKNQNHWVYLLKPSTSELWVEVTYPDWGGTAPPCSK